MHKRFDSASVSQLRRRYIMSNDFESKEKIILHGRRWSPTFITDRSNYGYDISSELENDLDKVIEYFKALRDQVIADGFIDPVLEISTERHYYDDDPRTCIYVVGSRYETDKEFKNRLELLENQKKEKLKARKNRKELEYKEYLRLKKKFES
jgi:hypothetical protein